MSTVTDIYLDESGFTGEDLVNEKQPVFALASTCLSNEIAQEITSDIFGRVKANELKQSSLSKRPRGRAMIVHLTKALHPYRKQLATENCAPLRRCSPLRSSSKTVPPPSQRHPAK